MIKMYGDHNRVIDIGYCKGCNRSDVSLYYCGDCTQRTCGRQTCSSTVIDDLYDQNQLYNQMPKRICEDCCIKRALPSSHQKSAAMKKIAGEDTTKNVLANNLAMFNDPTFSDFKFIFNEDKELQAHKAVLAAASPVFWRMFTIDMKEAQKNTCNVEGFSFEIFEHFLRFVYGGKLPENIIYLSVELFKIAHYYEVQQLMNISKENILLSLDVTNAIMIHEIAHQYELKYILGCAWEVVKRYVPWNNRNSEAQHFLCIGILKITLPIKDELITPEDVQKMLAQRTQEKSFWEQYYDI